MARHLRAAPASCRLIALLVVLLVLAAGCNHWQTLGYDSARSGTNPYETTIRVDNVGQLQEAWSADAGGITPPIVSGDTVFVGEPLRAYSANGTTGCAGTPRACVPLWSASGGSGPPTVANGVVYVGSPGKLSAYDAHGNMNCGGAPKTCLPLWTAPLGPGSTGSPAVANGEVFVDTDKLYAFDAAGSAGCSGSPKTCQPLWTGPGFQGATPSVANGVVYVAEVNTSVLSGRLAAFSADGIVGCSGSPKTCVPLWTYEPQRACSGFCGFLGPPSIVAGRLYVLDTYCCGMGDLICDPAPVRRGRPTRLRGDAQDVPTHRDRAND